MKLFKVLSHCLLFVYWCLVIGYLHPANALYDPRSVANNKIGVHILHPAEVGEAAKLVNSQGGDWGYVTVPIQPTDRDLDKWQSFMHSCRDLHLIPLIRITTIPQGGTWDRARDTDLVDFANFLNSLDWPVENRYIILFNEVNRSAEWGGSVDPVRYAEIVKNARQIFKERAVDFFLLGPALDDSLPDSGSSMSARRYMDSLFRHDNAIWSYFDGFATHSYPNPGFAANPSQTGPTSIVSYRQLFTLYKLADKPVFVTETGWDQTKVGSDTLRSYWSSAWKIWQDDPRVAAVTPFILSGGEQFAALSLVNGSGPSVSGEAIANLPKVAGFPKPGTASPELPSDTSHTSSQTFGGWNASATLLKFENIFRIILGLPAKSYLTLGSDTLLVELAQTPKQWEKGLAGRDNLNGIDGMLFQFPRYHVPVFWMKDTRFPLDLIWLKDNVVVEVTHDVPVPTSDLLPTYSPQTPVDSVLELPAGYSAAHELVPGTQLSITD